MFPQTSRVLRRARIALIATVVAACLASCDKPSASPTDQWRQRTQDFLKSTLELKKPFPTIHLPTGKSSLYEQSTAVVALAESGFSSFAPGDVANFSALAAGHVDGKTGLVVDEDAGEPPAASWFTLRALQALGQADRIGAADQERMVAAVSAQIADPKLQPDPFNRVYAFRLARLLAEKGSGDVPGLARAALARGRATIDCSAAYAAPDLDLWAVNIEMAAASGVTCPLPAHQAEVLLADLRAGADKERQTGEYALAFVSRVQGIALIAALTSAPPVNLTTMVSTQLADLRQALSRDQVEAYPVTVLTAEDALRTARLTVTLGTSRRDFLVGVLRWGATFAAFAPSASLFSLVARSLALLPGGPGQKDMSDLVDWSAVTGLNRLELATFLNPEAIRVSDFDVAIAEASAPPPDRGPSTKEPAASAGPALAVGRTAAVIAEAAHRAHLGCSGNLATWAESMTSKVSQGAADIDRSDAFALLDAARLLRFAGGCVQISAVAHELSAKFARRASSLLTAAVSAIDGKRIAPVPLLASIELSCLEGASPDEASKAKVLAFARGYMTSGIGVAGDDLQPVSLESTFAVLALEQAGTAGCSAQ